jgi:hypothetical protein
MARWEYFGLQGGNGHSKLQFLLAACKTTISNSCMTKPMGLDVVVMFAEIEHQVDTHSKDRHRRGLAISIGAFVLSVSAFLCSDIASAQQQGCRFLLDNCDPQGGPQQPRPKPPPEGPPRVPQQRSQRSQNTLTREMQCCVTYTKRRGTLSRSEVLYVCKIAVDSNYKAVGSNNTFCSQL